MPTIYDNIERPLLPALQTGLALCHRADFCVGYFNLRGWRFLTDAIESWPGGEGNQCRLLIGMQEAPREELRAALSLVPDVGMDQGRMLRLKQRVAKELRQQLMVGVPTDTDERALRKLAEQLRSQKVVVKLFLRHQLHAKLYLLFRNDPINPIIGYIGSSNLTFSGLKGQGELNVDVLDGDATLKLSHWFEERWEDRWCLDITEELIALIEESWAREEPLSPYLLYLKMAYHLSYEARAGLAEFRLPPVFQEKLFDYQAAAVKIAARHLYHRQGVLIGDVVGLGKTLMATALAKLFEDDFHLETLILCPKALEPMWERYRLEYGLRAKVIPTSQATRKLGSLTRHRIVIIDESHNFRNREGKTYRAIKDYIEKNESRVILLTATPYNKTYQDISNQLRLFLPEDTNVVARPEAYIRSLGANGEAEFERRHQCKPNTLAAFEKSDFADDWRDLLKRYMVRRTRSFIIQHYAKQEAKTERPYLVFPGGGRSYFPTRLPRTIKFPIDAQYAALYSEQVVEWIEQLALPRYGLGQENYREAFPLPPVTPSEKTALANLGRAGKRLIGFSRTNVFKRLESSGKAFLLSVERQMLRNAVFLYALEHKKPLPIGTQNADLLDARVTDKDTDTLSLDGEVEGVEEEENATESRAAAIYARYETTYKSRFQWIAARLFSDKLREDLEHDNALLNNILTLCVQWEAGRDEKLSALRKFVAAERPHDKILIFTQFADTARYLAEQLTAMGVTELGCVEGSSGNIAELVGRFSPGSNGQKTANPLRILISTDVLSEGQNLQDAAILINYDLPWAIIRLIQRAGRIDRIGQSAEEIICASFLPAEGVEKLIALRARLRRRLKENAEVVGTDETFFEDDATDERLLQALYTEKSGLLDGLDDVEDVDLASYAYQIWKDATDAEPALKEKVVQLPEVVFATKAAAQKTEGALVYLQTADGNDALAWVNSAGRSVTESQYAILKAAQCPPETPALPRRTDHHDLVASGVTRLLSERRQIGGQLGRPSGARYKTFHRLEAILQKRQQGSKLNTLSLFEANETVSTETLERLLNEIYRFPLTESARDSLNAHLRLGISDADLLEFVQALRDANRLCVILEEEQAQEPHIVCSMGLR
ncbi:helicase-related protein [Armatimonas sp.]|uniref:helicase-related protein n=1 Tax=Armatimonas sp. TaxID=1872638 RepID=UPI0037523728